MASPTPTEGPGTRGRLPRLGRLSGYRPLVWARRLSQGLFLLLFLYLVLTASVPLVGLLPPDLYLRTDPLATLASALASRELPPFVLWALPLTLLAVALGRAFCGWVCPLGTTLDVFALSSRTKRRDYPRLRSAKFVVLTLLLTGSVLGGLTVLVLDPLTLLVRSMGTAVLPGLNLITTALLTQLYQAGVAPDVVVQVDQALRPAVLPLRESHYVMGALMMALLVLVVGLNAVAPRFWCRYVCPLGTLYGILGRATPLRLRAGPECNSCGRCLAQCRMAAISPKGLRVDAGECIQCFACADECPRGAMKLGVGWETPTFSPKRRQLLAGLGLGVVGLAGLRVDGSAGGLDQRLIRPPGATADFLQRCIRCGECVKVCPTGGLQPSLTQSGLEGLWTPVLVSRIGNCEWSCNACGQVCPTHAIAPLSLDEKRKQVIGAAYLDQNRCLPWSDRIPCVICEEMCPVSPKAVVLEKALVETEKGPLEIQRPRVLRDRCVGCGICEFRCPVPKQAAIQVSGR